MKKFLPEQKSFKVDLTTSAMHLKMIQKFIFIFVIMIFLASATKAQYYNVPTVNPTGEFAINGSLSANTTVGDWLDGTGTGGFVLNNDGTPVTPFVTGHYIDPYKGGTGQDLIFSSGSKFNDDPNTWSWTTGDAGGKGDINNVLYHLANGSDNQQYLIIAGDRKETTGASYIDFEFLQNTLTRIPNTGKFNSSGPDGGRTAGDVVISIQYVNGGAAANILFYQWQFNGTSWTYIPITTVDNSKFFGFTNAGSESVPYTAFGLPSYTSNQFVEAYFNVTGYLQATNLCDELKIKTIMVKTKSSSALTAALDDFLEPIQVGVNIGTASISYNGPFCPSGVAPVTLSGVLGGTFTSTSGLSINSATGEINLSTSTPGTYTVTYTFTTPGCTNPKTATSTVIINPTTEETIEVTDCDVVTVNGVQYTTSGTYTQNLTNAAGCDSTLTINANVLHGTQETITRTECGQITINGITYTESGTYTQILQNNSGCNLVLTLNLTILKETSSLTEIITCDSYLWNGINYTQSGTYFAEFINSVGCDSTATLVLTINNSNESSEKVTVCDSYTWNGVEYTESGTYTAEFKNAAGCDSTATLILTINNSNESSEEVTACDSYTWNGVEYTESGTYTAEFKNAAGCDSTATLILTINNSTESSEEVTACDSYTWNGIEYAESGTYTAEFENAAGCDSTATLILTINNSTESSEEVTACDSYTWNGIEYTESGTYTAEFKNAAGCDSTATLILTINNSTESSEEVTACDSYIWNGIEYTESGTYTGEFKNAAGCDSTATLILTINNSTESSEEVTACDSYNWNGIEYTESGTYTAEFKNAAGCDSTATLILTINGFTENTINEVGCEKVVVNEVTYTESGIYTQTLNNAEGCDSLLTINVTITTCYPEMKLIEDRDTTLMNTPVTVCVKNNDSGIPVGSVLTTPANTTLGGAMIITAEGCVTYTPPTNYIGEEVFNYTITTPDGRKDSAKVTILIIAPDLEIIAVNDTFDIFNDQVAEGSIIINDINPVGDIVINTTPVVQPSNGSVVINTDGTMVYIPDAGFSGIDEFTYRICNSIIPDKCDEALVTIYVAESDTINPPPLTACDSILFIPDGFSPNDDGYNEYFELNFICQGDGDAPVEFEEKYPEARVEIYNRWGNLVYKKDNYGNVSRWGSDAWWDGRSNSGWTVGKDRLPAATYFYILYFNDGKTEPKAGTIFLNR